MIVLVKKKQKKENCGQSAEFLVLFHIFVVPVWYRVPSLAVPGSGQTAPDIQPQPSAQETNTHSI